MSVDPANVTGCIPTRGDRDLRPILDGLIFPYIVYDNSAEDEDYKVYGRYVAMVRATTEYVIFQDDDCVLHPETQRDLARYAVPGALVANMPPDRDDPHPWLGWGAIVPRSLATAALARYLAGYEGSTEGFRSVGCDIAVATLIPSWRVYLPFRHLPYAFDRTRQFCHPKQGEWKQEAYDRCKTLLEETA